MYVVRTEALDDLAQGGCALCRGADRVERAWLRGLLDEVGDAKVRTALERSGGLCASHVRLLVEEASASGKTLGLGVVLEVLLALARDELGERRGLWRSRVRGRMRAAAAESSCGACASVRLRERAYTELLLAAGDSAMQRREGDPRSALCRPHLAAVRAGESSGRASALLETSAVAQVGRLLAGVARSIAAHRAGSSVGPDAHEVVLRDAPDWLVGRAGTARTWAPAGAGRQTLGAEGRS